MVVRCTKQKINLGKYRTWNDTFSTYLLYLKIEIHKLPVPFLEYLANTANIFLVRGKTFFHLWWNVLVSSLGFLPKALPVILLTELRLYDYPGLFRSGFCYFLRPISFRNKSRMCMGISVTDTCFVFSIGILVTDTSRVGGSFYTIIRLKLKYLLFSCGTDTIKAWILYQLWEVLWRLNM